MCGMRCRSAYGYCLSGRKQNTNGNAPETIRYKRHKKLKQNSLSRARARTRACLYKSVFNEHSCMHRTLSLKVEILASTSHNLKYFALQQIPPAYAEAPLIPSGARPGLDLPKSPSPPPRRQINASFGSSSLWKEIIAL